MGRGATTREAEPRFAPSGFFALRSPLLPIDRLVSWSEGLEGPRLLTGGDGDLAAALERDAGRLRGWLRDLLARPEVREALFVASPPLEGSLGLWLEQPDSERGQKVERSLVKYVVRMASRSTPFGLFAGTSLGRIGPHTHLVVGPVAEHQRHTRLDGDYLDSVCRALVADPAVRAGLTLRPNSSLTRAAGRLGLVESRLTGRDRSYHLVAIDPDHYLEAVLERARPGARPAELAAHLVALDPEIALDEAATYIDELIDSQILEPELTPAVTGREPLAQLLDQLPDDGEHSPGAVLARAGRALVALDGDGLGRDPAAYRAIAAALEVLPAPAELPRLFQVDLVKPTPALSLSSALAAEVARAVELGFQLSPAAGDNMAEFRAAFTRRYEMREVPLGEVLDEESGIGFGKSDAPAAQAAPLLERIPFPARPGESTAAAGPRQRRLADRIAGALGRGEHEVVLSEQDVDELSRGHTPPRPPAAFHVMFKVAAPSPEALASGDVTLYLSGTGGPSGVNLLGRFCHADPDLHQAVVEHIRAEEAHHPDAIFAEIVHLPEGRIGNVIARPVLRGHEIPFLGRSGVPLDRQIPVSDLLVSVHGDQVVLRSRRLGRRVIPRLTSAHNYMGRSLGTYRFLCALQRQVGFHGIDLGGLELLPHRPRIRIGRVVLSLARWRVAGAELKQLAGASRAERFRAVAALRDRHGLPRWVVQADGDNQLAVDLDNTLAVDAWVQLVKDRDHVVLLELAPGPDQAVLQGPEGRFQHEIVMPFCAAAPGAPDQSDAEAGQEPTGPAPARGAEPPTLPAGPADAASVPRVFLPGSSWLYAKIYTGPATGDDVLRRLVAPLRHRLLDSGAADRWFFLRYADPDPHLRIRFHGEPGRLAAEGLPALHRAAAPLLAEGLLVTIQLDTYQRETERYGGPAAIDAVEGLFACDSDAVLAILDLIAGDEGQSAAWQLTLAGIDQLWTDLGLSLDDRLAAAERARTNLGHEHDADGPSRTIIERALGQKFRGERLALEQLLDPAGRQDSPLAPGLEVLDARSRAMAGPVQRLRAAEAAGQLDRPLHGFAWDLAHMYANRMLRVAARAQEMVLYDFLVRLYRSRVARARKGGR